MSNALDMDINTMMVLDISKWEVALQSTVEEFKNLEHALAR